MAAEGGVHETFSRGKDGKYQIRIESYDPARNTMKAIWLVSRSERVLTELLDKCEVPDGGNSDDDLRGNLLSVQRELQELRDAMDRSDGTQTPILDASMITTDEQQSGDPDPWSEVSRSVQSSLGEFKNENEEVNLARAVSAAPALDFGLAKRKRAFLSQIPLYSRPSIRTDFSVSFIDPFPELRLRPSEIPKPPKVPKKKKTTKPKTNKTSSTSKKKLNTGPSTKSAISGKPSQTAKAQNSKRTTSRSQPASKPIPAKRGTSSSRVSNSKKVSSFETIDEKKPSRSTKSNPGNKQEKKQRSLNTSGSIPRTSSRLSAVSTITPKTSTGRRSSSSLASDLKTAASSSYMQMYLDNNPVGSKTQREHPKTTKARDVVVKNARLKKQARSRSSEGKRSKVENAPPEVLPFESPPPASKLHSCPVEALDSEFRQSVCERSVSPLIRSVSIIDNTSEGRQTRESNNAVPRIRIDDSEEAEYQVKAYFLDDCAAENDILETQGSAIIPSSPVEVEDECTQEDEIRTRDVSVHLQETAGDENTENIIVDLSLLDKRPSLEEESSEDFDLSFPSPFKQESNLHKSPEDISKLREELLITQKNLEQDDSFLFDKDASLVSAPYQEDLFEENQATTQNDFGFLAEFEDEVSGLLDSIMSQEFESTFNLAPLVAVEDSLLSSSESFNLLTKEEESTEQPITNVQSSHSTIIDEPANQSETEPEQENINHDQGTHEDQEKLIVENEAHEDQAKTKKEEISPQEGSELATSDHPTVEHEAGASGVEDLSIAKEAGKEDHKCNKETVVTAESRVRRKSTGASLGKPNGRTTTATLRRRHSQSGLQSVAENTRRTSSKNRSQLEVEEHWSEEFFESVVLEDPSSRDPCGLLETSVILSLSSSELTVPDPCESYHDSSYGDFIPSLDQSRCDMDSKEALDEFKSLPYFLDSCLSNLNSFANPVALSSSESPGTSQRVHKGHLSFDYLAQKRQEIDNTKLNQHQGRHSTPNFSWREHPEDGMSSDEEKELDEIELCVSPKRHPYYLRDGQLRSHDLGLSGQSRSRCWETDSNSSSISHPETEEDSIEDSQKEGVPLSSKEQNSSLTGEFANNEKLHQERFLSETPHHLHVENSPPESLRDVPLPPKSDEVVVENQKAKGARKVSTRCGFLRFLTCSGKLDRVDNQF